MRLSSFFFMWELFVPFTSGDCAHLFGIYAGCDLIDIFFYAEDITTTFGYELYFVDCISTASD